jgi:dTDP-4-amino-4,6-dideoxygalactose transaminase
MSRIYLSPPHMAGQERRLVEEAFDSNFVAPLGPMVDAFEQEFAACVGVPYAAAVSSGTAALHLVLRLLGVGAGDEVWLSTLTFIGGVAPVRYLGATPVFLDVSPATWTLDVDLLAEALAEAARCGGLPRAVVPTDLYGQSCDVDRIVSVCDRYDVPVVTDSAEAAGAFYRGRPVGGAGKAAIFSFNGNKIITTSGGGMLVSHDRRLVEDARFLAQQAREPAVHYEHATIGYNYRMSNICAAIGRGQLAVLPKRVAARRAIFQRYHDALADIPGLSFMPEAAYGRCTRWLTVIEIDPELFGVDRNHVLRALDQDGIEARPVWKPMHLQPVFAGSKRFGGAVAERLFNRGLCLPSGSALAAGEQDRVIAGVRAAHRRGALDIRGASRASGLCVGE